MACCGTSVIPVLKMLELRPQILGAALCFDNDPAGDAAAKRAEEILEGRGAATFRLSSVGKDWNEDLVLGLHPPEEQFGGPVMQMC